MYERRAEELGIEPPVPHDQIAVMTFAMANGIALEQLLEPDAVPDDLFGTMLMVFFTGLRTLAAEGAPWLGVAGVAGAKHLGGEPPISGHAYRRLHWRP